MAGASVITPPASMSNTEAGSGSFNERAGGDRGSVQAYDSPQQHHSRGESGDQGYSQDSQDVQGPDHQPAPGADAANDVHSAVSPTSEYLAGIMQEFQRLEGKLSTLLTEHSRLKDENEEVGGPDRFCDYS